MRLIFEQPQVAGRSCDDCKKWLYIDDLADEDVGKVRVRRGKKVERGQAVPPCMLLGRSCPKGNPTVARTRELSTRNRTAFDWYLNIRPIAARMTDPVEIRNFAIIDSIVREQESISAILKAFKRAPPLSVIALT